MKITRRGFLGALAATVVAAQLPKPPFQVPTVTTPSNLLAANVTGSGGALTEQMLIDACEATRRQRGRRPTMILMNHAQYEIYRREIGWYHRLPRRVRRRA